MSKAAAELLTRLRAGVDHHDTGLATRELFEHWLALEHWQLDSEALPLLVGLAPAAWSAHLAQHGLEDAAHQLLEHLCVELGVPADERVAAINFARWCAGHALVLPEACQQVVDFISRVLAPGAVDAHADPAPAGEREIILGAALAVVTRFPERCRDAHGFFDGGLIAALILDSAARWFPLEPPHMTRAEMAALLESWLN